MSNIYSIFNRPTTLSYRLTRYTPSATFATASLMRAIALCGQSENHPLVSELPASVFILSTHCSLPQQTRICFPFIFYSDNSNIFSNSSISRSISFSSLRISDIISDVGGYSTGMYSISLYLFILRS